MRERGARKLLLLRDWMRIILHGSASRGTRAARDAEDMLAMIAEAAAHVVMA